MQTVQSHSLKLTSMKSVGIAAAFVVGNMLLPQLCHLIPQGGSIFLPIYFFTLVGAYKYGWQVGLLTAVLSPLLNSVLFGMPPMVAVPVIEIKSLILAAFASIAAIRYARVTFLSVAAIVALAFVTGGLFEWLWTGSIDAAVQDFRLGWPGLLIQAVGGWAVIRALR